MPIKGLKVFYMRPDLQKLLAFPRFNFEDRCVRIADLRSSTYLARQDILGSDTRTRFVIGPRFVEVTDKTTSAKYRKTIY